MKEHTHIRESTNTIQGKRPRGGADMVVQIPHLRGGQKTVELELLSINQSSPNMIACIAFGLLGERGRKGDKKAVKTGMMKVS